jgi:BolA family transcriptional regulator, general stress-responsive regulator
MISTAQWVRPSAEDIHARLALAFEADTIEVSDESHLHAGHAGAAGGAGHYRVRLISAQFDGKRLIQRHRLVYDALQNWMGERVHALTISAVTPQEARHAVSF